MDKKEKMLPTTVYLKSAAKKRLKQVARQRSCREADIIREAIDTWFEQMDTTRPASLAGLKQLADFSRNHTSKAPHDLSKNLDRYVWEEE